MDIFNTPLLVFACLLAIPTLVFATQVFLAPKSFEQVIRQSRRPRLAVLVPAHNEEQVIERTLHSIISQLGENDRLLVIADNCTDNTAALAESCGAKVIERQDQNRRGKGYALDFGLQHMAENDPPEVVIVIDADCRLSSSCIDNLARRAENEKRPVQALYLMKAPADKSVTQAIAEFAWLVKNRVRPLGLMHLGFPCQLMGTGMAFPWEILRKVNLAHGNMVEDMKLGIDLAILGFAPVFCPSSLVTSDFPVSADIATKQRTRWEHGHLSTIFVETPRLLKAAFQRRSLSLLAMAMDLSVPPLSVLGLCLAIMLSITLLTVFVTGSAISFVLMVGLNSIFGIAVFTAWYRFGRENLSFKTICAAPFYMLRKIPLYLAFLTKRQQGWVKTERR